MSVPALNVKNYLIVFILAYFAHSSIFEVKTLCDKYWASVQQDHSWLN